jgi:hypothetical protein
VALSMLLSATERERLYWVGADADQGKLAIDAITGYVDRTPALADTLDLFAFAVQARASGARLDILAADAASSWGLLPSAVFADELSQWADAGNPRRLWDSVSSACAKRSDAKLVVLTTAGDPGHFARAILDHAIESPMWNVDEVPGPSPWMDADRLAEQRARLLPSVYARLFENRWVASEDRLASPDELRECVVLPGDLDCDPRFKYLITLDLGLKRDRTAAAVAHREDRRVVLDRIATWQGTRENPVEIAEVEKWVIDTAHEFRSARIILDPHQGVGTLQTLRAHGFSADEYPFTATSTGRLAASLFNAIRDRAVLLPDDASLLDELATVRLRESSPNVYRLDHDAGKHDDQAIALALAVHTLLSEVQPPVNYSAQIAAIKRAMGPPTPAGISAERYFSGQPMTEEVFGGEDRRGWKAKLAEPRRRNTGWADW